jgi:hypothetical protein
MKKWTLLTAVFLMAVLCTIANLKAATATLTVSIDGASVDVPLRYEYYTNRPGGYYEINHYGDEDWEWTTPAGDSISFSNARLDPDPSLVFGSVAFDFGTPSTFSYTFTLPLAPLFSNPSVVSDSFSGSVTNGTASGGVTVTALPPAPVDLATIPVDGDGDVEMQVYTLSDDFGVTWKNVGLDLGETETVSPLAPFEAGLTTAYSEGPIPTIAGGPWTHMRADINFGLSGGGDSFAFSGIKILSPEPSTLLLALLMFFGAIAINPRNGLRSR